MLVARIRSCRSPIRVGMWEYKLVHDLGGQERSDGDGDVEHEKARADHYD